MSTEFLVKQLRGEVTRDDLCSLCALPRHLHEDTTGVALLGCSCAKARHRLELYDTAISRVLEEREHDQRLTARVIDVLTCDVGVPMTEFYRLLTHDEQLMVARRIVRRVLEAVHE